jgi:hypothetical protein
VSESKAGKSEMGRDERLAASLRENLKRRKAQAREQPVAGTDAGDQTADDQTGAHLR